MVDDHVANGAAALAFYSVLALFPGAIVGVSLLPHLPIPHLQQAVTDLVQQTLPGSAARVLLNSIQSVDANRQVGLLVVSLLFALWAASGGLSGIMQQLNVVFEVKEQRSFLRIRGIAALLAVSFCGLLLGALALAVFGGMLQAYLGDALGWSRGLLLTFATLRWIVIVNALQLAFSLVYYLGPDIHRRFRFVTPGAVVATVGLLLASIGLKTYVASYGNLDVLYGGLGAVVVILLWLFSAGWFTLFGAEIDDALLRCRAAGGRN
jgi:membrane protein